MDSRPGPPPPLPLSAGGRPGGYDAIVIGTGVGGTVTAALLAHAGRRVLVLEKNPVVGGILASYVRDGFKIDVGSHLVARGRHGPLGRVLRTLGCRRPRFLTHPIPLRTRGIYATHVPAARWRLLPAALRVARDLSLPWADAAPLARLVYDVLAMDAAGIAAWERRPLEEFLLGYSRHPAAYFVVSLLASIFFVLPPWEVSAGEAILGLRGVLRAWSPSYVEGGMDALPQALLGRVVAAGGDVVVSRRVVAIRRARGGLRVATADGATHDAPAVACNVAAEDLLPLLDGLEVPPDWAARARALRPSGNAHQLKLALRRPLVDEGCFIGGLSVAGLTPADLTFDLMRRTVAGLAAGRLTDPLAVYAPVPTNFDPTLAPPGCQLITASIYGSSLDAPADPPEAWKQRSLEALARAIPHLRDELLFAEFTPIPAIGAWMGKRGRGAIANAQCPGQVGADRLPVATPVPGLYLCGDGAGGRGIGLELAATSGMEVAGRILAAHRAVP